MRGVLGSPVQIRGDNDDHPQPCRSSEEPGERQPGTPPLPFSPPLRLPTLLSITRPAAIVTRHPPINGSSLPFLLFFLSFFLFFFFFLFSRGSILVHRHPFHPVILSLFLSLVFFFSFHRSIDVEQRRRMSGFISIDLGEGAINDQRLVLLRFVRQGIGETLERMELEVCRGLSKFVGA